MIDKRPRRPFPRTLGQCIEPVTKPLFKAHGLAGTKLLTEWEHIVGHKLARSSTPEKLTFPTGKTTGGTLTISVASGFATQLQHLQPVILEKLSTYYGYKAVSRITISHTFQPKPAEKPVSKTPVYARLPQGSEKLADEALDPELKEALKSLARSLEKPTT